MSADAVRALFAEHRAALAATEARTAHAVARAGQLLADALAEGRRVLACGNGGSAADAQHFAAELIGRFERERAPLPAVALSTDTSALTAIGNDYGFDEVFARQVRGLGDAGDVLVAISTSGDSPNVLRAAAQAQAQNMRVIALTGRAGGALGAALRAGDVELRAASDSTARIQEMHILFLHSLCALVDPSAPA